MKEINKNRLKFLFISLNVHFLSCGGIATYLGYQFLYEFLYLYFFANVVSFIIFDFFENLRIKYKVVG